VISLNIEFTKALIISIYLKESLIIQLMYYGLLMQLILK